MDSEDKPQTDLAYPEVSSTLSKDDKDFRELATSSKWLARIQQLQAGANYVKEGKISRGGGFVFIADKDHPEDLGDKVDVIVIDWRAKALRLKNNVPESQSFDLKEPLFIEIRAQSEVQKSGDEISCMWGPEFLLWVPSAKNNTGAFATYFMSSKTARREADNVKANMGKPATLGSKFIKTIKYSWHGPTVTPCSAPLIRPGEEDFANALRVFRNPPKDLREVADNPAGVDR